MIQLKQRGTGSWLDPRSSKSLAAKLSTRLVERCRGEKGVVVTLTYRREEFGDSRELYRAAQEEQHVPLFLRKVSRHLGESLKGRWFCKMEFQKGGWVHWHILILGVRRISQEWLTEAWGRGHVWIDRVNPKALTYLTKYVAKPGGVPSWIYFERPRSVKIIRVSPGFWQISDADPDEDDAEQLGYSTEIEPPEEQFGPPDDTFEPETWDPPEPTSYRMPIYECIGSKIERNELRFTARDTDGRYLHADADIALVLAILFQKGCGVVGRDRGWTVVDATLTQLRAAVAEAQRLSLEDEELSVDAHASGRVAAAAGASVNLIKHSNPDTPSLRRMLPKWLNRWFEDEAEVVPSC